MQIPIAGAIQVFTELKDEERYEVGNPEDHLEEHAEGEGGRFNRKAPRGVQSGDSSSTELDAVVSVLAVLFPSQTRLIYSSAAHSSVKCHINSLYKEELRLPRNAQKS